MRGLFVVLIGKLVFSQFGFPSPLLDSIAKLLMALTEAGVNLSSLTIFGSALGVGITIPYPQRDVYLRQDTAPAAVNPA